MDMLCSYNHVIFDLVAKLLSFRFLVHCTDFAQGIMLDKINVISLTLLSLLAKVTMTSPRASPAPMQAPARFRPLPALPTLDGVVPRT